MDVELGVEGDRKRVAVDVAIAATGHDEPWVAIKFSDVRKEGDLTVKRNSSIEFLMDYNAALMIGQMLQRYAIEGICLAAHGHVLENHEVSPDGVLTLLSETGGAIKEMRHHLATKTANYGPVIMTDKTPMD